MTNVDLLVVGGGVAGVSAALAASDLGARVVMVEKLDRLGGSCIYSAGNLLELSGPDALEHLVSLSFHTTPREVLEAYRVGLSALRARLVRLGAFPADVDRRVLPACWPHSPGANDVIHYVVKGDGGGGPALWDVLERALSASDVDVRVNIAMTGLVVDGDRVVGATTIDADGRTEQIMARAGVVLATGGFENDRALTAAYLPVPCLRPVGNPGNTGDG